MGIKGAHHPRASFSPHETAGPMKGQTDDSSCRQFLAGYIALRVVGPLDTYESMKITLGLGSYRTKKQLGSWIWRIFFVKRPSWQKQRFAVKISINFTPKASNPVAKKNDTFLCFPGSWKTNRCFQRFFVFTPNLGEILQFDYHFPNGLVQPPTRKRWSLEVAKPLETWGFAASRLRAGAASFFQQQRWDVFLFLFGVDMLPETTLLKTNMAPENSPFNKRKIIFPTSIFWGLC